MRGKKRNVCGRVEAGGSSTADCHELTAKCACNMFQLRSCSEGARLTGKQRTALHWAAKHGRVEVVKLLAGTHQADPNARSGYTPLHLAAMYNRQDVFDLLVHYGSDLNIRDYSGKKPRQYNTIASSTISPEHHKRKYPASVAARTGHPPHRGQQDAKYRPSDSEDSRTVSPDDTHQFKRAEKTRSSLFARGSIFSSKRKVKSKPSIVHTIVHPGDQVEDIGHRSWNNPGGESSDSDAIEITVAKSKPVISPKRGTTRGRVKRGQPGRPVGPYKHDPRMPNEDMGYMPGPPIRRGMGHAGPGVRGGKRYRGKPRRRNLSMSGPSQNIPPHLRRDRSATVPKDEHHAYSSDTLKSKLSRNVSNFSLGSLFSSKKKSNKKDASSNDLSQSTSYKNLSEAVDLNSEYVPQELPKTRHREHEYEAEGRSTEAPVQTFKPYRAASKRAPRKTDSPTPWPMPEVVLSRRSGENTSCSDSSTSIRPMPIKVKHGMQNNARKEVREPVAESQPKQKPPRRSPDSENMPVITSSKPSRVKHLVEQEKRASRVSPPARYEVDRTQNRELSSEETDSDTDDSETESDDSRMNKKLSALSIKAKLDAKKAKALRKAQASDANGETPV
ncbi:Ankyrin repeat-containing domain [Trinorchestia longiramus]|nr:Ankyrin repeat-containing domain [Trinorchestia longiramus]